MRFLITMNMPARSGQLIHQIICNYPAQTLEDLMTALQSNDFIMVEEFYKNPETGSYYSVGHVAVNHRYVGKVKLINHSQHMRE